MLCGLLAAIGCAAGPETDQQSQAIEEAADPFALERAAIEPWLAGHQGQLAEIESALDDALRDGYRARLDDGAGHARIVRTALVQWARLVRQHLREPLHTKVEALVEDPECHGSVAGDALLLAYVEAIAGDDGGSVEGVIGSLRELARQTACLGELQSAHLASQMVIAFDDVSTTLRINQLDAAIPYVAQAVAGPMLLVHEVERQHGAEAPLSRWFAEYELALVDGAATRHQPAWWHGLWLYDRITGRLRGFRATEAPADENDVDLVAFLRTVARPELEDQKCSFAEMIQRGAHDGRYHCLGARCRESSDPSCAVPSSASDTRPEDGAFDMPGVATTSLVACISNQVASPLGSQMACVIEATGMAANPRDILTKGLELTTLAGIKGGGACQLSMTSAQAWAKHDAAEKAARDKEQASVNEAIAKQTVEIDKLITAQKTLAAREAASNADPNNTFLQDRKEHAEAAVELQEEKVNAAAHNTNKETTDAARLRDAEVKQADEQLSQDLATTGRCAQDSECGNACGAMSAQAQKVLDCYTGAGVPQLDPLSGPGGCNGVCDPIDPDTDTGLTCLTELERNPGSATVEACWAARCGPSDQGACCGRGSTTEMGPPELRSLCEQAYCTETSATYSAGGCACGGSIAGGVPGVDPRVGPGPEMSFPLRF